MSSVSSLLNTEWRQGTILPLALVPDGALPKLPPGVRLLIISHDCDLVNPSYELEPYVEILVLKPILEDSNNALLLNGSSPRKIQFVADQSGKKSLFEIDIHEKYRLPRQILENGSRDETIRIDRDEIRKIVKWTSRRYDRPSFPSAFRDRLKEHRKKLLKKLKRDGDDVLALLVGFQSFDELPPEESYNIILRVLVAPDTCEDEMREQRVLSVVSEIRKLLSQCEGIEVADADLANSAELSLYDYSHLKRWDLDYLSPEDEQLE